MKFTKIMLILGSFLMAGAQLQASVTTPTELVVMCGNDTCTCPPKN